MRMERFYRIAASTLLGILFSYIVFSYVVYHYGFVRSFGMDITIVFARCNAILFVADVIFCLAGMIFLWRRIRHDGNAPVPLILWILLVFQIVSPLLLPAIASP